VTLHSFLMNVLYTVHYHECQNETHVKKVSGMNEDYPSLLSNIDFVSIYNVAFILSIFVINVVEHRDSYFLRPVTFVRLHDLQCYFSYFPRSISHVARDCLRLLSFHWCLPCCWNYKHILPNGVIEWHEISLTFCPS
jgi:hypothetical protein